jgi:lipopolysaccharide heptosyltransferase II
VIPRGVDLEEFAFHPPADAHQGPWRIGLFGRLSRIKGYEVALRAVALMRRQGLPVTLCIAGPAADSPARRTVDPLIRSLQLDEAVEWLGTRQDIPALIASVDLVVMPSTYPESFGRVVVEAKAVGRPVVASRIGALEELIDDGRSGLLAHPGDPEGLAQSLTRLINDAVLRARCVEEGRREVEAKWTVEQMVERTLAVYEECLTRPRILIWKLSALGDVILSTPSLRAVRRRFPHAHLALAVGRTAYETVARCPYLDDCLIYDGKGKDRGVWGGLRWIRRLRRGAFDLSIDLQNSRRTHLMAWAAGIPVRIGYRRKLGWLLNRGVRLPRVVLGPIAHQQHLLKQMGFSMDGETLETWPSALDEQTADRLVPAAAGERRQLVGLHPGGSGRWATKRWDLDRWARLCDALASRNLRVVITGGDEERALGDAIQQMAVSKPHSVIGQTTVMELACLIKRCDVFVAHDSSPLHLAAAVGTPTIALFGPTDPARHLPPAFLGQVIKKDVFCSPCYSPHCRTITHACMKRIGVDEVLSAVLGLLADAELRAQPANR